MRESHETPECPATTRGAREGVTRRDLLRGAASAIAAAAGAGVARDALGQVQGTTSGGGTVPLRLPMGALEYLDRKQYIKNMEIHSHVSGTIAGVGDYWPMWAKGRQRLLLGGGGVLDITDPKKPVQFSKDAFQGSGEMAYSARLKKWILVTSAAPPITPPTPQHPEGQYHPEYAATAFNYTGLRGIRTYDCTDPSNIRLLQEYSTGQKGGGTHTNRYDGGQYAFLDCGWDDTLTVMESSERPYNNALMIVDVSDPANVKEVSKWWIPGMRKGEEAEYRKYPFAGDRASWTGVHGAPVCPKRIEEGGTVGYGGWGAFGFYVHDFTDITKPKVWGHTRHVLEPMGAIPFHTCWPLMAPAAYTRHQNLVIGVVEGLEADCREPFHTSYVVDVKDKMNPRIVGLFPRPEAPPDAPYADFCQARGRFTSHNIQTWVAPGAGRHNFIALTYFNAGLRIVDLSNPREPKEVAYFVPPRDGEIENFASWRRGTSEGVFVEYDRNLIWLSTHEGLYCLSTPLLGKPILEPRAVTRWSVPHVNVGWDAQTPKSVYFGRGPGALA